MKERDDGTVLWKNKSRVKYKNPQQNLECLLQPTSVCNYHFLVNAMTWERKRITNTS